MSVQAVSLSPTHNFSKPNQASITLVVGHGVQGDCHAGATVQHRSRLKLRPPPPNLRQVHLMPAEILELVVREGKEGDGSGGSSGSSGSSGGNGSGLGALGLLPGQLGENITTVGVDLLGLGEGDVLVFFDDDNNNDDSGNENGNDKKKKREENTSTTAAAAAAVRITGLRNPCPQIEKFRTGLQERFIVRDDERKIVARKAGVMGVVERGGEVRPGMRIAVVVDDDDDDEQESKGFKPLKCV